MKPFYGTTCLTVDVEEKSRVQLLSLEADLRRASVVDTYLRTRSLEQLRQSMEPFYRAVLSLARVDFEDLYFEEVWLEKTVNYHIEIHFVE